MNPTIRTSSRLARVQPSITMAITAKAKKLIADGVDVVSFGAGEPDFPTPEHIRQAAVDALGRGAASGYTNVRGTTELRDAVAGELSRAHGFDVTADQVLVSCGAKHSLFNIFMAMLDDGDEVIVPAPYWVSYPDMVKIAGGNSVIVETRASDDFALTAGDLRAAITPKTRALVLNTPSNPTGAVYSRAALEAIAEVVVSEGLYVVSDDIYRSLVYGDTEYVSMASLGAEVAARTILVDGVSKTYAMTGWRIGYTAGPKTLIDAMAKIQSQSTSGASHIAQIAATAALTGSQDCVAEMRAAFDERRAEIVRLLRDIPGVDCEEPRGAFYAFPSLAAHVGKSTPEGRALDGDVALCEHLIEAGNVAIVPGSGFGAPGFARLSYACSLDDIRRGVARIAETLGALS